MYRRLDVVFASDIDDQVKKPFLGIWRYYDAAQEGVEVNRHTNRARQFLFSFLEEQSSDYRAIVKSRVRLVDQAAAC